MNGLNRRLLNRRLLNRCLSILAVFVLAGCNGFPNGDALGNGGLGSNDGAVLLEQLSLERINRARLSPGAEAVSAGITLNEGVPGADRLDTTPKQALAMNDQLTQAARAHSQDMLDRDYFAHDSPEGTTPADRVNNAGYVFTAAGENLAWRGTTGGLDNASVVEDQHLDLFVDKDVQGRGHRVIMLGGGFQELGIGIVRGNFTQGGTVFDSIMQAQNYGTPTSSGTFVLGVVYNDANGNGQYDYGEGVASATVSLGSTSKTTNAAGGYSFKVLQAGTYGLRFASGQTSTLTIADGAPNIKVDLVDGTNVLVNLGLGSL